MRKLRQRTILGLVYPGLATLGISACSGGYYDGEEELGEQSQALTVTQTFREGVSGYNGTTDTYIAQGSPNTNFGSNVECHLDGDDGSNDEDKSCLIRWALTGVPADAIITSASITLRALDSGDAYQLFELKRSFSESQATWNVAASGSSWGKAGALDASDRGVELGSVSGSSGSKTVTLGAAGIAVVQGWVSGTNHGIVVANTSSNNGIDLASSEHGTASYRPQLSITYETNTGSGGSGGSGGSSSGGSSGGGTGGAPSNEPQPNVLIAFMGDQGNGSNADAVLNLIKNEGAQAVVHNGDFDYSSNPTAFENRINNILGADFPYYAIIGNHDAAAWGGSSGYSSKQVARNARVPSMNCTGEIGVKANCNFRGVQLIESCIGVTELRSSCAGGNNTEQLGFINDSLASSTAPFKICNWHKNQTDMQTGSKSNEVGWQAYQACVNAGAIVMTGHEHSYERTRILTSIGSNGHGPTGPFDVMSVSAGQSFVVVSGLGGVDIRDFESQHSSDTWWATTYASNRWYKNGVVQSGNAGSTGYGALFVRFHDGGNTKRAVAYFKDRNGRLVDEYTITVP